MNGLILLGAGGHAKVILATAEAAGRRVVALYDDNLQKAGQEILGVPVRGPLAQAVEDHPGLKDAEGGVGAIVAIGNEAARAKVARDMGFHWASLVHPSAVVHSTLKRGPGSVVFAGSVIQPGVSVGAHAIVNTGAIVDHDCRIEDFVQVGPGTRISGTVQIEEGAFLGTGAVVLPDVRIGAWSVVGAGAVVTKDVAANSQVTGVPARARP